MQPHDLSPWTGPVIASFIIAIVGAISGLWGAIIAWRALRVNRAAHDHQVRKDSEEREIMERNAEPIFIWRGGTDQPYGFGPDAVVKRDFENQGGRIRQIRIDLKSPIAGARLKITPEAVMGTNQTGTIEFTAPGHNIPDFEFQIHYLTEPGKAGQQSFRRSKGMIEKIWSSGEAIH